MSETIQLARKEYTCFLCGETITRGTKYIRNAIAPWQHGEYELGDEGERVYYVINVRKWTIERMHYRCFQMGEFYG